MAWDRQPLFLPPHEWDDFTHLGRCFRRSLAEHDRVSSRRDERGPLAKVLREQIDARIRKERKSDRGWFWCATVGVQTDDGMTWSAETAAQVLRNVYSQFRLFALSPGLPEDLPRVCRLLGERKFLRRTADAGFGWGLLPFKSWTRKLLWVAALALTGLLKLSDIRITGRFGTEGLVATGFDLGLSFFLFAGLSLSLHEVLIRLSKQEDREAIRKLPGEIKAARSADSSDYWQLVERLVDDLRRRPSRRAIVVDDFGRLDLVTQDILTRYLQKSAEPRDGAEAWIVFEPLTGGLSHHLVVDPKAMAVLDDCTFYRQLALKTDERESLAKLIGRPEQAKRPTVKLICKDDTAAERNAYADMLRAFRQDHPRRGRYDELDLLYLLVLNARGLCETLDLRFLVDELSRKEVGRAEFLKVFLEGTALNKEELQRALKSIAETFAETPLLEVEDEPRLKFTVHSTGAFEEVAGELQLPAAGLGHLFWCSFWFERLGGSSEYSAFWIQKIAYHLLHSDLMDAPPEHRADALERTTQALLYALEGAVETCVYEPLPDLLDLAALRIEEMSERDGIRGRLRTACWSAYALTGDERGLTAYLRTLRSPADEVVLEDPLLQLFLDSTPVATEDRGRLARILREGAGAGPGRELLPHYARQRAAALALRVDSLPVSSSDLDIGVTSQVAFETLESDAEEIESHFTTTPPGEFGVTDLLALRWLLDNLGLKATKSTSLVHFLPQLLNLLSTASVDAAAEPSSEELVTKLQAQLPTQPLELLVRLAEVAWLLADQLSEKLGRSLGAQLVRAALVRDLGAVAIINLRLASEAVGETVLDRLDPELAERICEVVRLLFAAAGVESHGIERPADLLTEHITRRIERLGALSVFTFHQFELSSHALLAETRRTGLALRSTSETDVWKQSEPLRLALEDARVVEPLLEILAHLLLTEGFAFSAELRADVFLRAAATVLDQPFGSGVKRDFCLLALRFAHHLEADLTPALEYLIEQPGADCLSFLEQHLAAAHDVEAVMVQLLNVARRSPAVLRAAVHAVLERKAQEPGSKAESLGRMLALERLEAEMEALHQEPNPDARIEKMLSDWEERQDSWHYARLLVSLLQVRTTGRVVDEARRVLETADPSHSNNAFALLALTWAAEARASGAQPNFEELPLSFLRKTLPNWELNFSASTNETAYRLLCQGYDSPPDDLLASVVYWTKIKLQHEEAAEVLPLLRNKSYFRLFLYYARFSEGWGLPFDLEPQRLGPTRAAKAERLDRLEAWLRDDGKVASLFTAEAEGVAVASHLLLIGEDLFLPPLVTREDLGEARRRFDFTAKRELPRLLATMRSLPTLPQPLRNLLQAHELRFQQSTPEVIVT